MGRENRVTPQEREKRGVSGFHGTSITGRQQYHISYSTHDKRLEGVFYTEGKG